MNFYILFTATGTSSTSSSKSSLSLILLMIIMFVIMYFAYIRPRNKKQKIEHNMREEQTKIDQKSSQDYQETELEKDKKGMKPAAKVETEQKRSDNNMDTSNSINNNNFSELLVKAQAGDSSAQASIGIIYFWGKIDIKKDLIEAQKWFEKSASQNNPVGYWGLGRLYADGEGGLPKNNELALKYANKSIEQNCLDGMRLMAYLFESGIGVPKNEGEAYRWYRIAAEQGDSFSQGCLGAIYENGSGVPKNDVEAFRWFRMAAEQGNSNAQVHLGGMYEIGCGVPKNDVEACKWFRMAAEQGNIDAHCCLGVMYESGEGVPKDLNKALDFYNMAVNANNDYLSARAGFYLRVGRNEDFLIDLYNYYYSKDPKDYEQEKESRLDNENQDWFDINHNNFRQNSYSMIPRDEHFIFYTACYFVWNKNQQQRIRDGNSYTSYYATYGTGYVVVTDKGLYINALAYLSNRYKAINKMGFLGSVLSRTNDERKPISSDYSSPLPYDSIVSYNIDEHGQVILDTGSEISILPIFEQYPLILFTAIKIGRAGGFSQKSNTPLVGQDFAETLKKLKELVDAGVITPDEFDEKKKAILDKISI